MIVRLKKRFFEGVYMFSSFRVMMVFEQQFYIDETVRAFLMSLLEQRINLLKIPISIHVS